MKSDEARREFMDTYNKVRKPMPPAEKVIRNDKDVAKERRFDWRKELDNAEDLWDDDYKGINQQQEGGTND